MPDTIPKIYIVFYEDGYNNVIIDRAYKSYAKANKRVKQLSKTLPDSNDLFIATRILFN